MKRLAIVLGLVAACSGGQKPHGGTGSGSQVYAKKISLGWGFQAEGATTNVFLQVTDETGKQVSHPITSFSGECKPISPAAAMKAITGCACTGFELHAVVQGDDIVILKLPSGTTDPMAREEVTRIKTPGGAAIEAGT
ncbi:MAG TPA: hypothetical protein VFQ65_27295 [Kofleriaceae bacterium]|nr:hypothetical protein [Kofleriaceae bacterium]